MLVLNILLVQEHWIYQATLSATLLLILLGFVGALLARSGRKFPLTSAPYYLLGMNFALLRGFFQSFLPEKNAGWDRVERSGESPLAHLIFAIITLSLCLFGNAQAKAPSVAFDATLGTLFPKEDFPSEAHLDFTAHLWYPFDQMVFLGIGSGIQQIGANKQIPIVASASVRLPIGGQILPFVSGDVGHSVGEDAQFQWRAGGGLDIKNGDRSSLLVAGGYQSFAELGGHFYLRGGLLLEF